ncbi:uncharacterized protein [Coffea arabica]|uniref:Uncharacterized protein n=1 Tax=Coffea arabica TaxID=13443 RepID=A0ABM4UY77_COFAR|nr:uncharacterized protein LOC113693201 [Coffea arabica]
MAASTWRSSQPLLQSVPPSFSGFCSPKTPSSFSSTASTTFASSSSPKPFPTDSPSPSRVHLYHAASPATPSAAMSPAFTPTSRFSLVSTIPDPKRTCLCSPSTHPGAFRCKFHRKAGNASTCSSSGGHAQATAQPSAPRRLNIARFAIMNSFARNRIVRRDLMKRVFATLIRPSSPQQYRCRNFLPQPSRLSVTSKV